MTAARAGTTGDAARLRSGLAAAREWLPTGRSLPEDQWASRHRAVVLLLAFHGPALFAYGLLRHRPFGQVVEAGLLPLLAAAIAYPRLVGRQLRSCIAAVGLMVCSALLVGLAEGMTEAHFHFFVMVPVIALYEAWLPFLLAVGFVLVEHGVIGTLLPSSIYSTMSAQHHPWQFAGIHASFFAATCIGSIVNWRMHERARAAEGRLTEQITYRARHDRLTGLANRESLLVDGQAMLSSLGHDRQSLAVLVLDLDGFKEVNDTLGHGQGDRLLIEVAARLPTALRPGDRLARLGGDEFAVLLPGLTAADAMRVAGRLRATVTGARIRVGGVDLDLDVSIGVAVATAGGRPAGGGDNGGTDSGATDNAGMDMDRLLRQADVAMYEAKRSRVGVELYAPAVDRHSRQRLTLLTELRVALSAGQLRVHYQPKVALPDGGLRGVEALVRWQHPERGLLAPDEFIPAAESSALILPLTDQVLEIALRQVRDWLDAGASVPVAVNVTPRCLSDAGFPDRVSARLRAHRLPASLLRLEITESSLMADPDRAIPVLAALHSRGIGLSIDDFGTGYSSLSYLQQLPVDELKIDKSFVQRMLAEGEDEVLVRRTIQLGHELGLTIVAEGVEDLETAKALVALGCDAAQGFYFAHPVPAEQLTQWLPGPAGAAAVMVPLSQR